MSPTCTEFPLWREEYIGAIWYELFMCYKISATASIVEVAPWKLPKIWLWLARMRFSGILYIVEQDEISLSLIVDIYEKILPYATIIGVHSAVADVTTQITKWSIDVVCANHPLDDMFLAAAQNTKQYYTFWYGIPDKTKEVREHISHRTPAELDVIVHEVVSDRISFTNVVAPKYLMISQYKSYYYQSNNIVLPDKIGSTILHEISKHYKRREDHNKIIQSYQQDPQFRYIATS